MNNTNIFLIIGKSFSGKDTLLNTLLNNEKFCKENNIRRLVKYTTRKIRPNEVDGLDYHFITDEEYEEKFANNDNAVVTSFDSKFGKLHYVTDFGSLESSNNYIVTGDPESIKLYKNKVGSDHLCVIYLIVPNWVLFERFSNRSDNEKYSDKKYQEIYRRFIDDMKKFGLRSNSFLSGTNCIVHVNNGFYISDIMNNMIKFINEKKKRSVIINPDNVSFEFNTDYNPMYLNSYEDIMNGKIAICNGNIMINSEDSSFTGFTRLV